MDARTDFILFGIPDPKGCSDVLGRLRQQGIEVVVTTSAREFLETARGRAPAVAVLDDGLDDSMGGQVLIRLLRESAPAARVVLLLVPGAHPDRESRQPLVCSLARPVPGEQLGAVIEAALHDRRPASTTAASPVIFCVDDDALFLKSMVRVLGRRGYSVIAYDNPEEALEGIPIHKPSLLFIDVLMPGMSGLDLAAELREEYGDTLPYVLLTAKSSDQEISEGYRSGARYYITKPCEPERVVSIADLLLRNPGQGEKELIESSL